MLKDIPASPGPKATKGPRVISPWSHMLAAVGGGPLPLSPPWSHMLAAVGGGSPSVTSLKARWRVAPSSPLPLRWGSRGNRRQGTSLPLSELHL